MSTTKVGGNSASFLYTSKEYPKVCWSHAQHEHNSMTKCSYSNYGPKLKHNICKLTAKRKG